MKRSMVAFVMALAAGSTLLTTGCGTPGIQVVPQAGDFAFLEVKLKG